MPPNKSGVGDKPLIRTVRRRTDVTRRGCDAVTYVHVKACTRKGASAVADAHPWHVPSILAVGHTFGA
jgi:hypothetical protein